MTAYSKKTPRTSVKKPVSSKHVTKGKTSKHPRNLDRVEKQKGYDSSKESQKALSEVEEPRLMYTSKIRAIGNSQGVILNNQIMEAAGFEQEADVTIKAGDGVIFIVQAKAENINTDLSTWDRQFKLAIKNGAKPEGDFFEGLANEFDEKEW